jgi:hypothetical protein
MLTGFRAQHEPGFPYSNDVVYRQAPSNLRSKEVKTTNVIKALLAAFPDPRYAFYNLPADAQLDAVTLFVMRGSTAEEDPGLSGTFCGFRIASVWLNVANWRHVVRCYCSTVSFVDFNSLSMMARAGICCSQASF